MPVQAVAIFVAIFSSVDQRVLHALFMDAIVHLGVRASQGEGQERRAGLIKLYGVFGSAVSGISASLTRVLARVACFEGRPRLTLPGKICNPISRDQTERHAQTGRHADIKAHIMPGKIEHLAITAKFFFVHSQTGACQMASLIVHVANHCWLPPPLLVANRLEHPCKATICLNPS